MEEAWELVRANFAFFPNTTAKCFLLLSCWEPDTISPQPKARNNLLNKDPKPQAYNLGIRAAAKTGQWQLALHIFRLLPEVHLAPDVVSYNATISSSVAGWDSSSFLKSMFMYKVCVCVYIYAHIHTQTFIKMLICKSYKCECYNPGSCKREGRWQLGLHLFRSMMKSATSPNLITCNATIGCCDWPVVEKVSSRYPNGHA